MPDCFKGARFMKAKLGELRVEHKTLLEHIKERKADGLSCGKLFLDDLRQKFADQTLVEDVVAIVDECERIPDHLDKVLKPIYLSPRKKDFKTLTTFFEQGAKVPNQRSMAGIVKELSQLCSTSCAANMQLFTAFFDYIMRPDLIETYPAEWKAVSKQCDALLARSYITFLKEEFDPAEWWGMFRAKAKHIVAEADVDALLAIKPGESFQAVEGPVMRLFKQGELGLALAGVARDQPAEVKRSDILNNVMTNLLASSSIDKDVYATYLEKFAVEMSKINVDIHAALLAYPVSVKYRGVTFYFRVTSATEQFSAVYYSIIASSLVNAGMVKPFLCEDALLPHDHKDKMARVDAGKISASIVGAISNARILAQRLLDRQGLDSGAASVAFLERHQTEMYQLDPMFGVITAFLSSFVGANGVERLKANILALMPSVTNHPTALTVQASLAELSASSLRTFCGLGVGSVLDTVKNWVDAIVAGRPPNYQGDFTSQFGARMRAQLAYFCSFTPSGTSNGAAAETKYGPPAAHDIFCHSKAKYERDEDVAESELGPLVVFAGTLNSTQRADVSAWSDKYNSSGSRVKAGSKRKGLEKPSAETLSAAKVAKLFKNS